MTRKQIDASRELRLWIGQVIVPAVGVAAGVLAMHPEMREKAKQKCVNIKKSVKHKFRRGEA